MPGQLRLEPFTVEHLTLFNNWGAQAWLEPFFDLDGADSGYSASVFLGEDFLGCGGIYEVHPLRGIAWGIPVPGFPAAFRQMHFAIKRVLKEKMETYCRIEAYIDPEFSNAVRWVKSLGFREECSFKPYFFPDGRAGAEWVITREH